MPLINLFGRLGQGNMPGHGMNDSTNNPKKAKAVYEKNLIHETGAHTLSFMNHHERNGGRGNGMGLGHQNQHHHRRAK